VVIVGLTALAVLLVLSLADEPNRRNAEAEEQEHVAIERGIDTYVTYCLACHGPAGEGSEGGERGEHSPHELGADVYWGVVPGELFGGGHP